MSGGKSKRPITGPERTMVLRVLRFFEKEKLNRYNSISVDRVLMRTSVATGVSLSTIKRIRREERRIKDSLGNPDEELEVDLPTPGLNRKKRVGFKYSNNILDGLATIIDGYQQDHNKMMPLKEIFAYAKNNLNFPGQKETLRKLLVDRLGYVFESSRSRKRLKSLNNKELEIPSEDISSVFLDTKKGLETPTEDIPSVFLDTSIEVEALDEENIKTEREDVDDMEPEIIMYEVDIKQDGIS